MPKLTRLVPKLTGLMPNPNPPLHTYYTTDLTMYYSLNVITSKPPFHVHQLVHCQGLTNGYSGNGSHTGLPLERKGTIC